ncbi:MAG: alpha/beta hydrolase family protein [Gaiellaceae bacterium]
MPDSGPTGGSGGRGVRSERDDVDGSRVAVLGSSFGGYLALRCGPDVPGLRCVVDVAGPYELEPFAALPPVVREGFAAFVGAAGEVDAAAALGGVSLAGALARVDVPSLVVHGGRDGVFPAAHGERIAAELPRAELWLEPEGNHACNNLHTTVRPAIADWVAERL